MQLIAARRERLLTQIASQRLMLTQNMQVLHSPLTMIDRGLALLRFIKGHPAWVVGIGTALIAMRPVGILKWAQRGWITWGIIRKLREK